MKTLLVLFLLVIPFNTAFAWTNELLVTIDWPYKASMDEFSAPAEHQTGLKLFGGMGFALGYRGSWDLGAASLGFFGQYGWKDETLRRKVTGSSTDTEYNFQTHRMLYGPFASLNVGSHFRVLGEYLPAVSSNVIYSDGKSENPFRKDDKLKGSGWGIGFGINLGWYVTSLIYRNISYADVDMNGANHSLPDSNFSKLVSEEIAAQVGFMF